MLIARAEVLAVHRTRSLFGLTDGIRFETPSGDVDGILFTSLSVPQVLFSLGRLGWPVVIEEPPAAPSR